jgi:hypothetical protein
MPLLLADQLDSVSQKPLPSVAAAGFFSHGGFLVEKVLPPTDCRSRLPRPLWSDLGIGILPQYFHNYRLYGEGPAAGIQRLQVTGGLDFHFVADDRFWHSP